MAGLFGGGSTAFNSSGNNTQLTMNAWDSNVISNNIFGSDGDSAIGSSADPTPTHKAASRYI